MDTDYCSYLRAHLSHKLARLAMEEVECRRFGVDDGGHGAMFARSVIFYQGHGLLVAVSYSPGDSVSCFVGPEGANPQDYEEWPSLQGLVEMEVPFPDDPADPHGITAYIDQFPEDPDGMLDFVATKVAGLLAQ